MLRFMKLASTVWTSQVAVVPVISLTWFAGFWSNLIKIQAFKELILLTVRLSIIIKDQLFTYYKSIPIDQSKDIFLTLPFIFDKLLKTDD